MGRLRSVFARAGVATRYMAVPPHEVAAPGGHARQSARFVAAATDLLETAAVACLGRAGLAASDVDAIVAVSTTGIATPSLDAHLMDRMPFRADVLRTPVFGLGCAGGVSGLARAADMARALPGRRVLLLVVELCSLTFRPADRSPGNIVATALFGDGAAAVLVEADADAGAPEPVPHGWRIGPGGEHRWARSLDVMGWRVEDDGLGVVFSPAIPALVREKLGEAADLFLARQGLTRDALAGLLCHPGGAKVLDALAAVFPGASSQPAGLALAGDVLRTCGNMSAATVLFVLERAATVAAPGPHLMLALGPGFTASFLLLAPTAGGRSSGAGLEVSGMRSRT